MATATAPAATLYRRSVEITFTDGTRAKRATRFYGVRDGFPLPAIPAEYAREWTERMSAYAPVASVRFSYRRAR
jgi:hypothetical protein